MKNLAIQAENISKQYRLGQVGTGTLSHDLNRWWHKVRGKEDPYLKIGETNDRTQKGESQYVWSLKDINFDIEQGSAVGIIGRNGAGKSTLLKLLSKVTQPTTGCFKINGRIASLLEVGTGFHPEMTGRENIYLNGAILGMTRKEIKRKFDEIVAFSGVEKYIDTPVKRYSSGMYVRLAFAVAAHLESEILIVDEVLAVGDAEFQKKCIGKMGDVSKGEGRTVLFVSHNMAAVKQLCSKGILLKNGTIAKNGNISNVIDNYLSNEDGKEIKEIRFPINNAKKAQILQFKICDTNGNLKKEFNHSENISFKIKIINTTKEKNIRCNFSIYDQYDTLLFVSRKNIEERGEVNININLQGGILMPNSYKLSIALDQPNVELYDLISDILSFEIVNLGHDNFLQGDSINGLISAPVSWT